LDLGLLIVAGGGVYAALMAREMLRLLAEIKAVRAKKTEPATPNAQLPTPNPAASV
jgi:hypothetical protein